MASHRHKEQLGVGRRVNARAFCTPSGRVFPAYVGTIVGVLPRYVVVRDDATGREACHKADELTVYRPVKVVPATPLPRANALVPELPLFSVVG